MPGAGKSTLGKQVARALNLPFYDLDKEIEGREGRSIPEIFDQSGEDHFRLVESAMLREFAARADSFILATGGGAPCFFDNIEILNASGLTVYLQVGLETLIGRLHTSKGRPLLQNGEEREVRLKNLLESRQPVYRKARITVTEPDLDKILRAINRTEINK